MEPTVRTENLTKTFHSRKQGRINAIDKLSLDCFPSEIYGLLGPNGAGKTTTLRILATLLSPTQGKARVLDYDVSRSASEVRACVGFLATETGLYEGLTPVETLNFFGQINGLRGTELEQRRQTVLDILDMGEFADRRVAKLSTGMKQKLSLARSIIHDPPVLIFDEPTYGLDVMTAKTVLDYIESFRKQDKTIIISTHLMNIAEKLCDRVGILFDGHLETNNTLPDLLEEWEAENLEDIFFAIAEEKGVGKEVP